MCDINWVTNYEEVVTFLNDDEDSAFCGLSTIEELSQDLYERPDGSETDSETLDIELASECSTTSLDERFNDEPHNKSDNSDSEKTDEHLPALPSTHILDLTKSPTRSSVKRKRSIEDEALKKKQRITFDSVTVFHFPRMQGFTCVPSEGGCTLGMSAQHSQVMKFSIEEHAIERLRRHRRLMLRQLNFDEDDINSEDEFIDPSESELDSRYFLTNVRPKNRRALLSAAGVRKVDASEARECRDLRQSRKTCGCDCGDYCGPDTCSCSQNGINCQGDVLNFPCTCNGDCCENTSGRTQFDMDGVRTHLNQTLMRLNLEKTQEDVQKKSNLACTNNEGS